MSKLQELIQRLCPDGVEFVKLGDYIHIYTGSQFNRRDMKESGTYPVINGGVNPSGYTEVFNEPENTISLSQGGASAGYVAWQDTPFWAGAHCFVVRPSSDKILNRFLYFFLKNQEANLQQMQHGAGIPALNRDIVKSLLFPIVPVEVQEEIVKILDRFADYAAELQAELQARKQQYEYYRNLLLTFNPSACGFGTDDEQQMNVTAWGGDSYEIHWKKMGEIGTFYGGLTGKSKEDFSDGNEAFISYMNVFSNIAVDTERGDKVRISPNERQNTVQYGDALFTGSSETREECGMSSVLTRKTSKKLYLNSFCFGFRLNNPEIYNPEFLKHLLRSNDVRSQIIRTANGVTRFNVSKKLFANIVLPIPPLEVQERIVAVLDRFETLVNDLNEGLPREIELRRKQYEHYRDRLLSFPDISRRDINRI